MNMLKIITLGILLVIFSVAELWAEEVSPNDIDEATLIQYARQLQETKSELFAGAQGVLVLAIAPNSQAEKKGLQRGDIIIAYNGQPVKSAAQLFSTIQANAAKPQIELQFFRAGAVQTVVLQGGKVGVYFENIDELGRLNAEANQAYQAADYSTALDKWQMVLEQARKFGKRHEMGQCLGNLGRVYDELGQYQNALESYRQALAIFRELSNHSWESGALNNLGVVYRNLGEHQKSLDYYQQALAIDRKLGDQRGIGNKLTNIGMVYDDLGQYQKALKYCQEALTIHRKLGDQRGESADLTNLGAVYKNLGQYQKALKYFKQALAIARDINDISGVGGKLTNIGVIYDYLGDYPKALQYQQKAWVIYDAIRKPDGKSAVLTNMGVVYKNMGQYQKALEYYKQALAIDSDIDAISEVGNNLNNLGVVYDKLGNYLKALEYFQQSLEIKQKLGEQSGVSITLNNLGGVYSTLAQYPKALEYYQQALAIDRNIDYISGVGNDLGNIGVVYNKLGDYPKALEYYQQALEIMRDIGEISGISSNLDKLGVVHSNLGQYKTALDYHQQALEIRRDIGDISGVGDSFINLGTVYSNLAQYQKAIEYFQQALDIKRDIEDINGIGDSFSNFGLVYDDLGQYQKALEHYLQALEIHRDIGDRSGEGADIGNIGLVYDNFGEYQKALDYYQQALVIHRDIGNKRGEGYNLGNIGGVYHNLGNYPKALIYYQQALVIHRNIGNRKGESAALGNMGIVYATQGKYQKALTHYQQALTIDHDMGDKRGEGINIGNLGTLYHQLGDYPTALNHYRQALIVDRNIGDINGESDTLSNFGTVYSDLGKYQQAKAAFQKSIAIHKALGRGDTWLEKRGLAFVEAHLNQPELAIQHYEQSINNLEQLRAGITKKEHKISFMRRKIYVYDELIALLQSLHPKHPKKGYDRKAIEIFERKQGRVFLEEIGKSGARRFSGIPLETISQEQSLTKQLEQTKANLRKQRAQPFEKRDNTHIETLNQQLKNLKNEQRAFTTRIQKEYPKYYALKYPQPVDLATLQNQVLQKGEMMLVYGVLTASKVEKKTILWVIGKHQFQMLVLDISEEELQAKVDAFRQSPNNMIKAINEKRFYDVTDIDETLPAFRQPSYDLYTLLMPEKAKTLLKNARTLYIVPTGPLYGLPFGALDTHNPTQHDTPHYLIQDYPIAYLSSASLLKTIRDTKRDETSHPYPFLAFAHPKYPKNCSSISDDATQVIQSLRTQTYLKLAGSENEACFAELSETKAQAEAIAKLFKAPKGSNALQLRDKASRSNVFDFSDTKRLDDYQYVLFAAHAVLPNEITRIKQSAIVLSNPDTEGYLTMADAFALDMNADLVMLSACNTGRGKNIKGEGVRGLTRAFMYAGTPAVSVSLWSVESQSAKTLSISLFKYLQAGKPLAQALRQSKLDLMADEDRDMYQHPYFWAPFVVFGDGN